MKINISGLSEGIHRFELTESPSVLGLAENLSGTVTAQVTLEKSVHQILVTVDASVKGVFVCDRCADEFSDDVRTQFTSVYSWEQREGAEEGDDFHILGKEDNIIDIAEPVREYLMLAVPLKLLCRKNCELPAVRNEDPETVDPRWEKLRNLLKTEKN